jgi:hypothetical protein
VIGDAVAQLTRLQVGTATLLCPLDISGAWRGRDNSRLQRQPVVVSMAGPLFRLQDAGVVLQTRSLQLMNIGDPDAKMAFVEHWQVRSTWLPPRPLADARSCPALSYVGTRMQLCGCARAASCAAMTKPCMLLRRVRALLRAACRASPWRPPRSSRAWTSSSSPSTRCGATRPLPGREGARPTGLQGACRARRFATLWWRLYTPPRCPCAQVPHVCAPVPRLPSRAARRRELPGGGHGERARAHPQPRGHGHREEHVGGHHARNDRGAGERRPAALRAASCGPGGGQGRRQPGCVHGCAGVRTAHAVYSGGPRRRASWMWGTASPWPAATASCTPSATASCRRPSSSWRRSPWAWWGAGARGLCPPQRGPSLLCHDTCPWRIHATQGASAPVVCPQLQPAASTEVDCG